MKLFFALLIILIPVISGAEVSPYFGLINPAPGTVVAADFVHYEYDEESEQWIKFHDSTHNIILSNITGQGNYTLYFTSPDVCFYQLTHVEVEGGVSGTAIWRLANYPNYQPGIGVSFQGTAIFFNFQITSQPPSPFLYSFQQFSWMWMNQILFNHPFDPALIPSDVPGVDPIIPPSGMTDIQRQSVIRGYAGFIVGSIFLISILSW